MNEAIAILLKSPAQHRTLERRNPTVSQDSDRLVPLEALIDPEKPVEPDELVEQFVPVEKSRRLSGRFALLWMLTSTATVRRGVLSQCIRCWRRVKDGHRSSKCCKVLLLGHAGDPSL